MGEIANQFRPFCFSNSPILQTKIGQITFHNTINGRGKDIQHNCLRKRNGVYSAYQCIKRKVVSQCNIPLFRSLNK